MRWDILTGEYPPQPGGVSDYTRQVAEGFAAAGDEVHVWAPACENALPLEDGVVVHRLRGGFNPATLWSLERRMATDSRRIILVQYVAQAFGYRGANLPFCLWLAARRRQRLWTLFHEVRRPFDWGGKLKSQGVAAANWTMAALVANASRRIYVSTPAWKPLVAGFARCRPQWLPVPSNLPLEVPREVAAETRARLATGLDSVLVGHFGIHSIRISPLKLHWMEEVLAADPRYIGVIIGYGATGYARDLLRRQPSFEARLRVIEGPSAPQAAAHLAACDVMVQPYPDGATTRRGTLMASLALGKAVVTNRGPHSESFWPDSGAVSIAGDETPGEVAQAVRNLMENPEACRRMEERAAELYRERFAVERAIAKLRADAEASGS